MIVDVSNGNPSRCRPYRILVVSWIW